MANGTAIAANQTNLNNFSPTGYVNIVSGLTNPISLNCGNSQQINVGDPIFQYNDSGNAFGAGANAIIGLPPCCLTSSYAGAGGGANGNANNNIAFTGAVAALQSYLHNNFTGMSIGYRSPKNTSAGKASDINGVACGRIKVPVDPNSNNGGFNAAGSGPAFNANAAWPVGTPWSISGGQNNQNANNANATGNTGYYVPCGNVWNQTGANLAIGRQALPKAVNDPFVWLDVVSLVASGTVEVVTGS